VGKAVAEAGRKSEGEAEEKDEEEAD